MPTELRPAGLQALVDGSVEVSSKECFQEKNVGMVHDVSTLKHVRILLETGAF